MQTCELCMSAGGEVLWRDQRCRVIRVGGADAAAFPGYCRVIWQRHVQEMSDLVEEERDHLLRVVMVVERVVRKLVQPDKINLASLGNVVPHLHWHVIPRWGDDSHFPASIWAPAARPAPVRPQPQSETLAVALRNELGESA